LNVHLVSGPDNLEWSIIRHTSPFAKIVHVGSWVPLLQFPHDLPIRKGDKFSGHLCVCDCRPWAYFSRDRWSPFLILFYCSPLTRASYWSSMWQVKTFLVNPFIFTHFGFFFEVEKKLVLVRGKECRGKGSKRDEKGQKKVFFNCFSPHVR
jgi:hypothetical protein